MRLDESTILLIEDNPGDAGLIQEMLVDCGLARKNFFVVDSLAAASRYMAAGHVPDVIFLDLNLPDSCGIATLEQCVGTIAGRTPVIVLTGNNDEIIGNLAIENGAEDYLVKGDCSAPQLARALRYVLQRSKTQQSLRDSVQLFKSLFHEHSAVKIILDPQTGAIIDANQAAADYYGWSIKQLQGMNVAQINTLSPEQLQQAILRVQNKEKNHFEFKHRRSDGSIRDVEVYSSKIVTGGREFLHSIVHDISERKLAETENERLRTAIEQAGESIVITDTKGEIVYVNPMTEKVSGYTRQELLGINPRIFKSGLQNDAFYTTLWTTLSQGKNWQGRLINRRKDGTLFTEAATISPVRNVIGEIVYFVAVKRDITEYLLLEAQLQQAQKMESVGRLAGGVAHDFNNMLSVILGFTQMAMSKVEPGSSQHDDLQEVLDAAQRSANITRQLLAFARKQTIAPQVLNLNEVIEGMLKMLRRLIGEDINLVWQPSSSLWSVKIDPSQMDQILANLCVNARDAIVGIGSIAIATGKCLLDDTFCACHIGAVPGEYVFFSVTDTGCGMNREIMDKIFEPFFTTKELGQGTGLGLATVYGIVKQNEGFITADSQPGQGTTFTIYLPRHWSQDSKEQNGYDKQGIPRGKGECVLLVEDEAAILRLTKKILESAGYKILTADTPSRAIALAGDHAAEIVLLLTDVVMPEMNGKDLANQLKTLIPQLKCLFMSGYTASVIAGRGVLDEGMHFIQKPFSAEGLAVKVREVLLSRQEC